MLSVCGDIIYISGRCMCCAWEVEIIFQELFVTIRSALLQLLPVSDTFFGNFFTLFLGRKITANCCLIV